MCEITKQSSKTRHGFESCSISFSLPVVNTISKSALSQMDTDTNIYIHIYIQPVEAKHGNKITPERKPNSHGYKNSVASIGENLVRGKRFQMG